MPKALCTPGRLGAVHMDPAPLQAACQLDGGYILYQVVPVFRGPVHLGTRVQNTEDFKQRGS